MKIIRWKLHTVYTELPRRVLCKKINHAKERNKEVKKYPGSLYENVCVCVCGMNMGWTHLHDLIMGGNFQLN